MWKWLRSWFAWRFSLRRLVIATVFLGAVVGLNMKKIGPTVRVGPVCNYWGWPLPFYSAWDEESAYLARMTYGWRPSSSRLAEDQVMLLDKEFRERWAAAESYRFPLTHQAYSLLDRGELSKVNAEGRIFFFCTILDAAINVVPLFLILFLQIPRRREPSPPPVRDGG